MVDVVEVVEAVVLIVEVGVGSEAAPALVELAENNSRIVVGGAVEVALAARLVAVEAEEWAEKKPQEEKDHKAAQ